MVDGEVRDRRFVFGLDHELHRVGFVFARDAGPIPVQRVPAVAIAIEAALAWREQHPKAAIGFDAGEIVLAANADRGGAGFGVGGGNGHDSASSVISVHALPRKSSSEANPPKI